MNYSKPFIQPNYDNYFVLRLETFKDRPKTTVLHVQGFLRSHDSYMKFWNNVITVSYKYVLNVLNF